MQPWLPGCAEPGPEAGLVCVQGSAGIATVLDAGASTGLPAGGLCLPTVLPQVSPLPTRCSLELLLQLQPPRPRRHCAFRRVGFISAPSQGGALLSLPRSRGCSTPHTRGSWFSISTSLAPATSWPLPSTHPRPQHPGQSRPQC